LKFADEKNEGSKERTACLVVKVVEHLGEHLGQNEEHKNFALKKNE
jgi:hypothetical protein